MTFSLHQGGHTQLTKSLHLLLDFQQLLPIHSLPQPHPPRLRVIIHQRAGGQFERTQSHALPIIAELLMWNSLIHEIQLPLIPPHNYNFIILLK